MNRTPLVSIVTPSYNQAEYLEETISSVLKQDYPRIEYIIMDGGSTDDSVEIIKRHAEKIDYWVSEPDQGQADAINRGLRMAKGEIVGWINSDDVYLPGAVSEAVAAFIKFDQAGLVYGDGLMVSSDLELYDRHYYAQLSLVDLLAFEVILQPATFIRKAALDEVGYLDPGYDLILDHELWVRIASRYPIIHVPRFWALERTHARAKTIASAEQFVAEAERMIETAEQSDVLGAVVSRHKNRVSAGLAVFSARRLIDAKKHPRAFRLITMAIFEHPATVLKYWYKWVQAAMSSLGFDPLFMWYRKTRRKLLFSGQRIDVNEFYND